MRHFFRDVTELAELLDKKLTSSITTRFVLAGGVGFGVIEALLWVGLSFGFNYIVAIVVAFETSVIVNFVLNDSFTFHAEEKGWLLRLGGFEVTTLLARVLNIGVYLSTIASLGPYLGEFAGVVTAFSGNYLMARLVIWRKAI